MGVGLAAGFGGAGLGVGFFVVDGCAPGGEGTWTTTSGPGVTTGEGAVVVAAGGVVAVSGVGVADGATVPAGATLLESVVGVGVGTVPGAGVTPVDGAGVCPCGRWFASLWPP